MNSGIALTQQVAKEFPATSIIILTMQYQQQYMLQAIQYGVKGYLLKTSSIREVVQAIRTVHEGGMCIEPQLTSSIVKEYRRLSSANAHGSVRQVEFLTEKECEIARCVARGMSNKEIAQSLSYSEKTVKNYLSVIFQKLHLHDRTQVAIFALRQGLLPEENSM
jgi:DNA-binding NarL/FixJ family response regulator